MPQTTTSKSRVINMSGKGESTNQPPNQIDNHDPFSVHPIPCLLPSSLPPFLPPTPSHSFFYFKFPSFLLPPPSPPPAIHNTSLTTYYLLPTSHFPLSPFPLSPFPLSPFPSPPFHASSASQARKKLNPHIPSTRIAEPEATRHRDIWPWGDRGMGGVP
jgi:hypothetical protein